MTYNTMHDVIYNPDPSLYAAIYGLVQTFTCNTTELDNQQHHKGDKTLKSEDWQDIENVRNQAIAQLAEVCAAMGLSWTANAKEFSITLPDFIIARVDRDVPISNYQSQPTRRKTFDISTWGEKGPVEGMPDDFQMPDYGEILDEGVPPQGDKDAES